MMKDINDFKNKLKDQDELMSLDEVKGILAEPPTGFFAAKWKQIGTLAIAILGAVTALFWILPSDNKVNLGNNKTSVKSTIDSSQVPSVQEDIVLNTGSTEDEKDTLNTESKTLNSPTQQIEKGILEQSIPAKSKSTDLPNSNESLSHSSTFYEPFKSIINVNNLFKNNTNLDIQPNLSFEEVSKEDMTEVLKAIATGKKPKSVKPIAVNNDTESTRGNENRPFASESILENSILLTPAELEKFYIFQHDDILLFSRSREDKEALELIYKKGSSGSTSSSTQQTPQRQIADEYPKAVVTTQTTLYRKWSTQWSEISCDKYLPILVKFDHGIADYSVWWFEKTEKNIAKLPERYAGTLNNYCLTPKAVTSDTTYKKGDKRQQNKTKEKHITPYAQEQVVNADTKLLQDLDIHFSSNKLTYTKRSGIRNKKQYRYNKSSRYTSSIGNIDYKEEYQKKNTPILHHQT